MRRIGDLLERKGPQVWSIAPQATVFEALERMAEKDIGGLLVMDRDRTVGIFTERDYARQVVLRGKASKDTRVEDVMTRRVIYVRPEQTLDEAMALMTQRRIRHLPVVDGGKLLGLVSIGDIVKSVIAEKQFVIAQLENYIQNP